MCNALRLYFRWEVIVRPQVTVQTVFKINFDKCRKIHTHFSSHQKNMCKTNRFIKAGVQGTPLLEQNHTLNHQKTQNNIIINY